MQQKIIVLKITFLQNGENSPLFFKFKNSFQANFRHLATPTKIQHDSYKGIFVEKKMAPKSRQILSKQFCEIAIFRQ
jgi:hypothetical protein